MSDLCCDCDNVFNGFGLSKCSCCDKPVCSGCAPKHSCEKKESEISPELQELLDNTPPTEELLDELESEKIEFHRDPVFVEDSCRDMFHEDLLKASQNTEFMALYPEIQIRTGLYLQIGIKQFNLREDSKLSLEDMAEISAALGYHLHVRMISPAERLRIVEAGDE